MLKFFMVVDFLKDSWPNELDHQVQHFHNQPRDPPAPRCKPMMMEMFVGTLRKLLILTQNNLEVLERIFKECGLMVSFGKQL